MSTKCKVRGQSSALFETPTTHTFEFDGVEVDFVIITKAEEEEPEE